MYDYDRRYAARYRRVFQAMSLDQAKQVLGFPPGSVPSPAEVSKAYKTKAIQNHPDRGGSHEVMVDLNAAKDILEGKRREDRHPPVSWSQAVPTEDSEARRRKEEEARRAQARAIISAASNETVQTAQHALNELDIFRGKLHLPSFLAHDLNEVLVGIGREGQGQMKTNHDMWKAMDLALAMMSLSHKLAKSSAVLQKAVGQANADFLNLGGGDLVWETIWKPHAETVKFIREFGELVKMSRDLMGLIRTSENVPIEWDDLFHHPQQVLLSFENDFRGFADHGMKRFEATLKKAVPAVKAAAAPYGFKTHRDWADWRVPRDFEEASKLVEAVS